MEGYKVVIVDDDSVSVEMLSFCLGKDRRFLVEGVAKNGKQGKKVITKVQPDLLFLDVEMPDMTGMDLLQSMRDTVSWNMRVVFYTAFDKYMIQAIRQSAFDYLLKPFEEQDLKEILERFVRQAAQPVRPLPLVGNLAQAGQTFIVFTPTNDMREVMLSNQPPLALRRGVTAEQIVSYSSGFVQIHQSYIINIDYLMLIKDNRCLMYPPFDKVTELSVSKKYKRMLQDRFCL